MKASPFSLQLFDFNKALSGFLLFKFRHGDIEHTIFVFSLYVLFLNVAYIVTAAARETALAMNVVILFQL